MLRHLAERSDGLFAAVSQESKVLPLLAKNPLRLGHLLKRTILFVTLVKMNPAGALDAQEGFEHALHHIDAQKRLGMTYDQGMKGQITSN